VCWPFKLLVDRTGKRTVLFKLDENPGETVDFTAVYPAYAARLASTLDAELASQINYHREESTVRETRFQPRMRHCPDTRWTSTLVRSSASE
jgi:hypothetical protein